jgi:hypothetical protein
MTNKPKLKDICRVYFSNCEISMDGDEFRKWLKKNSPKLNKERIKKQKKIKEEIRKVFWQEYKKVWALNKLEEIMKYWPLDRKETIQTINKLIKILK